MSIDSTSSSIHCKKVLKSSLSQGDNYSYSSYLLKDWENPPIPKSRTMSIVEEASGDLLTDLSSLPFNTNKTINHNDNNNKYTRRFSELKPSLLEKNQQSNTGRRNSTPQLHFGALLPNPFRSKKHHGKHASKDDTHTPVNSPNNSFSLHYNDMMTTKTEQPLHTKSLTKTSSIPRTNLSISNDRLSSPFNDDSASSSLFTFRTNYSAPGSAGILRLEVQTPLCIAETYRLHFYDYFHTNYSGEFEHEGTFLASLRCFPNKPIPAENHTSASIDVNTQNQARVLIRTFTRNYDVSISLDGINDENILQSLLDKADLSPVHSYKAIGDPKANEKIYLFDKANDERQNCKIGVIYQGVDQANEFDIFSNDGLSTDMSEFLKVLADRVSLKGFHKYRGDLDIKDDLHGDHSYYTIYDNHEIMFNVAPIIPSSKANGQCIERKSLVGNAFVCIVFQHPDADFTPDYIAGKVTQVYITVKPCIIDEELYYKIGIWHRNDFTALINPPGGTYKNDESFRDYFLTLLLNAINAAIESPSLKFRVAEQRQRLKQEELKKLLNNLSSRQSSVDSTNDSEHNNSRSESILSITTQSTNDSLNSNSGRISPVNSKKRTFSKLFGVFMGRSGSISSTPSTASLPTNLTNNNNSSSSQSSSLEAYAAPVQKMNKENERRRSSVKYYRAPPPPPTYTTTVNAPTPQFVLATQPPTPPPKPSQSFDAINEDLSRENNNLQTDGVEENIRTRANSTPDAARLMSKTFSASVERIKEEINSISSSITDDDDDNVDDDLLSDDDKIEHRHTLTETPLTQPPIINS